MRAYETGGDAPLGAEVMVELVIVPDDGLPQPVTLAVILPEVSLRGHAVRPAHLARPALPWRRAGEW